MTIINIIDAQNNTQTIQQVLENANQIEFIIKDCFLNKIRVVNTSGDVLSEIAMKNGKIDYFISYLNKESFISESKVAGFTIKPNIDNMLNVYENYRSETYYSQHEIPIPDSLSNGKNIQYIIERDAFGNKIFEGQGLNKLREGKGVLYHHDKQVKYEGFFNKDKYHGFGIEYHYNGNKYYEGEWVEGMPEGDVNLYYCNGDIKYSGAIKNGKKNGYGTQYALENHIEYEGYWLDDHHDGEGKLYKYPGMLLMEGDFGKNEFDGKKYYPDIGKICYEGKMIWDGSKWVNNGKGRRYFSNGNLEFDGVYNKGSRDHGSFYYENGKMYYKGYLYQFDEMYNGYGEVYDLEGNLCTKGQWNMGELEYIEMPLEDLNLGYVTYKFHERDGGQIYLGQVTNGEPNGYGMQIDIYSGIICEEGNLLNNCWHGLYKWFFCEQRHKYLKKIGHYSNCETIGRYGSYHKNGKLEYRSTELFESDDKFGIFYQKNGKIDLSRSYKEKKYPIKYDTGFFYLD